MAKEMLSELAPLLAEEGIDLEDPARVPDRDTLNAALSRAVERQNLTLFTPVGHARELAADTLQQAIRALHTGDTAAAGALLEQAQPESPDGTAPTVAGCIGLALGRLDAWLSGRDSSPPAGLAGRTRLPAGHWVGERAAVDILALAAKGRACDSLDRLMLRRGGQHVLYGSALALTATLQTWARQANCPLTELTLHVR